MTALHTKFSDVRVLIFDLDGTLIDSSRDLADAVNSARARMGLPPHSLEKVKTYIGHGARELVRKSLSESIPGLTEEELTRAVVYFREFYGQHLLDHTETYPGVREALELFAPDAPAGRGRTLAVLTNKPVRFTQPILAGLDLIRHFRFVYGEESFPAKKPDPIGVQSILRDTGMEPHQAVLVGDSGTDVLTARNAGIGAIGVTYGLSTEQFAEFPPDILLDRLTQLPEVLNGTS